MGDLITYLKDLLDKYSTVITALYGIITFVVGYCTKFFVVYIRRYKIRHLLGLNLSKKSVVLYVPIRNVALWKKNADQSDETWNDDLVIYDEMKVAAEMRKCIADLSADLEFNIGKSVGYNPESNSIFIGGFLVHPFLNDLFTHFAQEDKIRFSTTQKRFDEYDPEEQKRRIVMEDHGNPYRYIFLHNNDVNPVSINPSWEEAPYIFHKENGKEVRFTAIRYDIKKEEVFFLLRLKNRTGMSQKEEGTTLAFFSMTRPDVSYYVSRAFNQNRNTLYTITKKHKDNYFYIGKCCLVNGGQKGSYAQIDYASIIDATDIFF